MMKKGEFVKAVAARRTVGFKAAPTLKDSL